MIEQQQVTSTSSSNITYDFTRTDREYLVQVGYHFWIVRMTKEQQEALSARLQKDSVDGLLVESDDLPAPWAITNLSAITTCREPITIEQYLNEVERKEGKG